MYGIHRPLDKTFVVAIGALGMSSAVCPWRLDPSEFVGLGFRAQGLGFRVLGVV